MKIINKISFFTLAIIILSFNPVLAQVPYNTYPDWQSSEDSDNGTGCDFGDVNGDGYLDLAVSNGNDITMAHNFVYINENGFMPNIATWVSADSNYSGHCQFGDINGDGYPELMVANYISDSWQPAVVQIYANNNGVLDTFPSWQTADSIYSFRAAFGDADGDGDLDLAVATGEPYHGHFYPNLIYFNEGGTLETTPGWISAVSDASYDVFWVDIDNDYDLDLAFSSVAGPVKIYYNYGDSIGTVPGWQSDDIDNGNSFDFADLNGDGYFDMGVAYNTQLDGSGLFKIYFSNGDTLHSSADWQSSTIGYGSEAVFSDVDNDGDYDFITGRWWGRINIYLNSSGNFNINPDWISGASYQSVIENITFCDVDRAAEINTHITFNVENGRRLFYLSDRQLQSIDSVIVDGQHLELSDYCYHLVAGWVSLKDTPSQQVIIYYSNSPHKDMAVSNWDRESYIFTNTNIYESFIAGDANGSGQVSGSDVTYLVSYFKGNVQAPQPYLAGDANGDCLVNGADVTYLVIYFKGFGAPPFYGDC